MQALQAANPFDDGKNLQPVNGNSSALEKTDQQRAIAEVQAAMMIARMNPRNPVQAMDKILNACTRKGLAETGLYQYSKGGADVSGASIRLAETMAQCWGNIQFGFRELYRGVGSDGVTYSEVEAFAWDIETNTRRPVQFRVRHWRDTRSGGHAVTAERDIYELTANMAQRRVRACILAIIPGDVEEAARHQCELTLTSQANTSPEAMKKMVSAFEEYGVSKAQIEKRIQRRIESIQPAQVVSLKKIYASLRDGMSSREDWFEEVESKATEEEPKELPVMTDDEFSKKLTGWLNAIEGGKKTAEQIIGMVSAKYQLTEQQQTQIKGESGGQE